MYRHGSAPNWQLTQDTKVAPSLMPFGRRHRKIFSCL
jgi:hypothetical protein